MQHTFVFIFSNCTDLEVMILYSKMMFYSLILLLIARDLTRKLTMLWNTSGNQRMISLVRGFFEFQFENYEHMLTMWDLGTIDL